MVGGEKTYRELMAELMGGDVGASAPAVEEGNLLDEEHDMPQKWQSLYKETGAVVGRERRRSPFGDIRTEIRRGKACVENDAIAIARKSSSLPCAAISSYFIW